MTQIGVGGTDDWGHLSPLPLSESRNLSLHYLEIIKQLYIIFSQVEHIIVNEGKGVNKEGKDDYIIDGQRSIL